MSQAEFEIMLAARVRRAEILRRAPDAKRLMTASENSGAKNWPALGCLSPIDFASDFGSESGFGHADRVVAAAAMTGSIHDCRAMFWRFSSEDCPKSSGPGRVPAELTAETAKLVRRNLDYHAELFPSAALTMRGPRW